MNNNRTPLRERIAEWLRGQGHNAIVETSDDRFSLVAFRARGLKMGVRVDELDPAFLFISLVGSIPDDVVDELLARRAAELTETRLKVVKVSIDWEARVMTIAAEQFVTEPGGPEIFWRTVQLLSDAFGRMYTAFDECIGRNAASEFTGALEAELAKARTEDPR